MYENPQSITEVVKQHNTECSTNREKRETRINDRLIAKMCTFFIFFWQIFLVYFEPSGGFVNAVILTFSPPPYE